MPDTRGQGSGGQKGKGRGGKSGVGSGSAAGIGGRRGGPGGSCVCPSCGQKEPHLRGTPCIDMHCSKCGHAMVRETTSGQ
jgi:hypothetical protein